MRIIPRFSKLRFKSRRARFSVLFSGAGLVLFLSLIIFEKKSPSSSAAALLGNSGKTNQDNGPLASLSLTPPELQKTQSRTPAQAAEPKHCTELHHLICSANGITRDPTGLVQTDIEGELSVLRIYEEIVRTQPDWALDQLDEALIARVYTEKKAQFIKTTAKWVSERIIELINSEPRSVFSDSEKTYLKKRIKDLELEVPTPKRPYTDEPELYTKNEVIYERTEAGKTRLRFGGAYLFVAKSWFNLVFTLAHEIAHSIDPCELNQQGKKIAAYEKLTECFQQSGLLSLLSSSEQLCAQNELLAETFADWVASQISAIALQKYQSQYTPRQMLKAAINSVRDLCDQDEYFTFTDMSQHPSPEIRIDRIFSRNPKIRSALGCQNRNAPYCQWQ